MDTNGTLDYNPTDLELHFGNTCNLHCKMCSQQFSHMIGKELLKMGQQDPDFLKWVKKESGVLNNWTGELDIQYDWYKNKKIKQHEMLMKTSTNRVLSIFYSTKMMSF